MASGSDRGNGDRVQRTRFLLVAALVVVGTVALTLPAAAAAATCAGQTATIAGSSSRDTLNGTPGDDVIAGLGGSDTVYGAGGNDVICAGTGNDGVHGGAGDDHVFGEDGYDFVVGAAGGDVVDGGAGMDAVYGSAGGDVLHGGAGSDYLRGGDDNDTLGGDDDGDALYGDAGANTLDGGNGSDVCLDGTVSACENLPSPGACPPAFASEIGVRNISRFAMLDPCRSVTATVRRNPTLEDDGDETFSIIVDGTEERIHIEFVPRDSGHLVLPVVGARISLTGAHVTDDHGNNELHPVYQEVYQGQTYTSGPQYAGNPDRSDLGAICWYPDGTSCSWTTTTPDTSAPTPPSALTASAVSANEVALSWTASTDNVGVTGYKVLRNGTQIATSTSTTYRDTTVAAATQYTYTVAAFDAAGNTSAASNPATVTTPPSGGTTLTFSANADAYVQQSTPTTNYGAATEITADNSPIKNLLVRFNVAGISGRTITSAKLRLYCVGGAPFGGDFRHISEPAATSWSESTVNWNTAPLADSTSLATLGSVATGQWYEVNVKPAVTGDGVVSLKATSTSTDGAHYSSKEGTAGRAPQLVITVQ